MHASTFDESWQSSREREMGDTVEICRTSVQAQTRKLDPTELHVTPVGGSALCKGIWMEDHTWLEAAVAAGEKP